MRMMLVGTVLIVLGPGCDAPRSRVHGTVKFQGKPLAGAIVTFFGSDQMTYTADTGPDGTYQIAGVPRGPVRVSVQVQSARPRPRPDPDLRKAGDAFGKVKARAEDAAKMGRFPDPPPPSKGLAPAGAFPAKYGDPKTSELSFELKEPDQEFSPELK